MNQKQESLFQEIFFQNDIQFQRFFKNVCFNFHNTYYSGFIVVILFHEKKIDTMLDG